MNLPKRLTNLVAEHAGQWHAGALDGGDRDPELGQRGRHLGADEAEPYHDGTTGPRGGGANAVTVLDGAELEDPLQRRTGHREHSIAPTGGHQQPVVSHPLAALELDELLLGVDRRRPHPERELDALLGIIGGGFDELILEAFLLTKIALGQRRAVVGQLGLGADEPDLTVKPLVAQGRGRRGPGQRGTYDDDAHSFRHARSLTPDTT